MSISFRPTISWQQVKQPEWTVDEWGADVATVVYAGPYTGKDAFEATLTRGVINPACGLYVQKWSNGGSKVFPEVTVYCKGFRGVIPAAFPENGVSTRSSQISATITSTIVAEKIKGKELESEETDEVDAIREVLYEAQQTTWHYISPTQPVGPTYNTLAIPLSINVLSSRIVATWAGKEVVFSGANAPAALATALYMPPNVRAADHTSVPILGTPYWECSDLVIAELLGG